MLQFYPQIKLVHISLALCSGSLFALRGAATLAGMRWPRSSPVRYLSYTIDVALLTAAMMLFTILPGALFANGWLAAKLTVLAIYILLGLAALRAKTACVRIGCYAGALLAFAQIYCIARTHHPLGALYLWLG